jgi:hypothetical protein
MKVAARLHDQRRVGGHAIKQAGGGQFLDVGDFGGVGEEFHGLSAKAFCEARVSKPPNDFGKAVARPGRAAGQSEREPLLPRQAKSGGVRTIST